MYNKCIIGYVVLLLSYVNVESAESLLLTGHDVRLQVIHTCARHFDIPSITESSDVVQMLQGVNQTYIIARSERTS